MSAYRDLLQQLEVESQRTYDRAVMTLSGGALGVSFAFIKDFIPLSSAQFVNLLIAAWVAWGLSISAILFSHLLSVHALRAAIHVADGVGSAPTVSMFDRTTSILNATGGALFLLGIFLTSAFVGCNLGAANG